MTSERRNDPRRPVRYLRLARPVQGAVLNLTEQGMAVESLKRLEVGTRWAFVLERGEEEFRISGTVQWCRLIDTWPKPDGDQAPIYRAGIEFFEDQNEALRRDLVGRFTCDR